MNEERFWSKVERSEWCWEWTAAKTSNGYGAFRLNGQVLGAHRVAYELLVGPIPEGLTLDHLCRNRGCVNPLHLDPCTIGENTSRAPRRNQNIGKTVCVRGHEFTEGNTVIRRDGKRACRECYRHIYRVNKPVETADQPPHRVS